VVLRWACHDPAMIQPGLFPGISAGMFLIWSVDVRE
jgi:hypothetical protein